MLEDKELCELKTVMGNFNPSRKTQLKDAYLQRLVITLRQNDTAVEDGDRLQCTLKSAITRAYPTIKRNTMASSNIFTEWSGTGGVVDCGAQIIISLSMQNRVWMLAHGGAK